MGEAAEVAESHGEEVEVEEVSVDVAGGNKDVVVVREDSEEKAGDQMGFIKTLIGNSGRFSL